MNYEEVANDLKNFICELDYKYENGKYPYNFASRESLIYAINAIEKQIPKKPLFPKSKMRQNVRCPICNSFVGNIHVQHYYCPHCGQALDWE